jgi:hypothetical protein
MTPTLATLRDFRTAFGPAFGFRRSPWRTTRSLVDFAKQTFGGGRLRRIEDDAEGGARFVVLAPEPQKIGNAFPTWAYHV